MVITETYGLALSWWKIMHFLLSNSRCFSLSAAFSWEQYLLVLVTWSSRGAHKKDSLLILLYIQHHLWMKTAFRVVGDGSFHLPHGLFHFTSFYSIYFSLPIIICFKIRRFSLRFSRESHVEIWSRKYFPSKLCRTQTSKWLT